MNIVTRIIEDDKGFCMDDLINIFGKDKDESAVLTWKYKDESGEEKERTERCFYMDNNRSEVSAFYVQRNDRRFDKVFVNIDISQIKEINFVRLDIIQKYNDMMTCQKLETKLKEKVLKTFVIQWKYWLDDWAFSQNKRKGDAFEKACVHILMSEINGFDSSYVMDIMDCTIRKWMEWRGKFVSVIDYMMMCRNRKYSTYVDVIEFIYDKLHNRCSK